MVAQTTVKPKSSSADAPAPLAVAQSTGELLVDAITLAELQSQLVVLDLREDIKRIMGSAMLIVIGAALALSCLPAALAALALWSAGALKIELWLAFLLSAGVGAVLAMIFALIGSWRLHSRSAFFTRSRTEWKQNAKWLKTILRQAGSPPRRRESAQMGQDSVETP